MVRIGGEEGMGWEGWIGGQMDGGGGIGRIRENSRYVE